MTRERSQPKRVIRSVAGAVFVGARTGQVGLGAKFEEYDERFENVMVTYGAGDQATLAQIRAAVAALKN